MRTPLSFTLGIALGLILLASSVSAQPASPEARQLFEEGVALERSGKWGRALTAFERALAVEETVQIRFHMARVKEQLGRLVEALDDAREAENAGRLEGVGNLGEIEELKDWLEARTPQLVLKRGAGTEGAVIAIDGKTISDRALTEPVRLDPGSHTIEVRLVDGARFEEKLSIGAGEQNEMELVRPEGLEPPPPAATTPPLSPPKAPAAVPAAEVEEPSPLVPYVVGGVGAAGLVASGVFLALRNAAVSDLDEECRGDVCPQSLESKQNDAKRYTTVARITLGVGIAGLGAAAFLLLTRQNAGPRPAAARGVTVAPVTPAGAPGVHVAGSF